MKKSFLKLVGGAVFLLPLMFASCGNIDNPLEILDTSGSGGGGGGSEDATSDTYIKYTAPGTSTNEPIGDATKWEYIANADVPAGTYYVEGTVNCAGKITLTGDVNLILKDGAKLTVKDGIRSADDGANLLYSLTIFAQSNDPSTMGNLVVNNDTPVGGEATAIVVAGLTLHGGKIDATADTGGTPSDNGGAGIEVGATKLIVYDGVVNAKAKKGMSAIYTWTTDMEFYGGTVTAVGDVATTTPTNGGTAIYGPANITIKGNAIVKAYGGAGVTGNDNGGWGIWVTGDLIISENANVDATSGSQMNAIDVGGNITISGGEVKAVAEGNLGNGLESITNPIVVSGGKVTAYGADGGGTLGIDGTLALSGGMVLYTGDSEDPATESGDQTACDKRYAIIKK